MNEREAFEAHMLKLNACTRLARQQEYLGGHYRTTTVQRAWNLWRASRQQALVEAAEVCDGMREDKKEADTLELFRLAESTGKSESDQLRAGRFWLDVSTFNAGLRRASTAIRSLTPTEGVDK